MKRAMLLTSLVSISLKLGKYRGKLLGNYWETLGKDGKQLGSTDKGWVTFGRRTTRCVYGVQVKTGKMKTGGGTLGEIGKTLYIVHCQKLLTFAVYNITGRDPLQSVCV